MAGVLAAAWLWVAVAFHLQRFASINWAAVYYAGAFVVQATLVIWFGVIQGRLGSGCVRQFRSRAGLGLFLFALAYPLLALALGRPWAQAEVFGVAPDPTVLATLGFLLMANGRAPWVLLVVPLLWCVLSGATLWTMKSPEALLLPSAALLVVGLTWMSKRSPKRPTRAPSAS
jgi:hypothetical protein